MVFLLLLTLVAGTVMNTSILEFRMAGNSQFREEAFQKVQAAVTSISEDIDNFVVAGGVGYTNCMVGDANPDCDEHSLIVDATAVTVAAGSLSFNVVRQGPEILPSPPVRMSEDEVSSSASYDYAVFEAGAEYSGSDQGLGNAEVAQGIMVRFSSGGQ
jgi:Tfp pilus assembly protein PilX